MDGAESVDFFISYTSADRPWAEWIAWTLEEAGYSVRVQAWDFGAGSNFALAMHGASLASRHTVAVLSPAFLESEFAAAEWAAAFQADPTGAKRKLLPVRVRECDPGGLVGSIVYVDLVGLPQEVARERLLGEAEGARAKPEVAPQFPGEQARAAGEAPALPSAGAAIWNVPPVRGRFVGREGLLEELQRRLSAGEAAALTQVQALHGLGGVGKTRLAVEFAHRHRDEYDVVWWVRCEDPVTMLADYATLAEALGLPEQGEREQDARVVAVRSWLGANRRWLLVFDNATGPDALDEVISDAGTGHVLITSRRDGGWRRIAEPCPVDVWSRAESVAFLQRRTGDNDDQAAAAIADALGDLPLALEQAAAYVDSVQISLDGYRRRLESHAPALFEEGRPADYEHTVSSTWALAFAEVEQDPGCSALLFCSAFLAPEQIPRELFASDSIADGVFAAPGGELALDKAIKGLLSYSLITGGEDDLSIHRLVQHVVRNRIGDDGRTWLKCSEGLLTERFPRDGADPGTWPQCERLLSHAMAVADHARHVGAETAAETAVLLSNVARYLHGRAEFVAASQLWENALRIEEAVHGTDNAEVAVTLGNLAITLRELGDLKGARERQERALEIFEAVGGPIDREVARTLLNLGLVLLGFRDLVGARELLGRALEIFEELYGPDDLMVGTTLLNLGMVLSDLGETEQAHEASARALRIVVAARGPSHPQVALALGGLGSVLRMSGDLDGAREYKERALGLLQHLYGTEHPNVAREVCNLGNLMAESGDLEGACEQYRRALAIFEMVYGPDHPDAIQTRLNLRHALDELGERRDAGDPPAPRTIEPNAGPDRR